jgi:outer membrane protein OmpA-like peptidoglycan-associated protein
LRSAILNPSFDFEYYDNVSAINIGLARWFFNNKFLLRTSYYNFNLGAAIGFIVPINQNSLRIEYEYRYPLSEISDISSASHQFLIAFGFLKKESSFEISVFPKDQEIFAGQDATLRVNISRTGQFNTPIDLKLLSPENIVPTSVVPQRLKTENTATFVIRTSKQTQPKNYYFNIVAHVGGKEKIVAIRVAVKNTMQAGEKEKPNYKQASALEADVRASVDRLLIKETTKIRSRDPLLPYIFFEENQHALNKERYNILNPTREPVTKFNFSPERLLDIPTKYQNTLNVIAKRLWDNPHMEIIVRGYNSNWGAEKGNIELSQRRAESVRDYLVNNCGVRSWQIKTEAFYLPPDPASNLDPRGREENQRVEISCPVSSQPILDPIVTETSEIATSDDICRFEISNFQAGAGLRNWKLVISEAPGDTFKLIEGNKLLHKVLPWDWKNDAGQSVAVGKTYRYKLLLQDENEQTFETNWKTIQVEKVSAIEREYIQKNIEKTRLILFKYDRADMDLTSKSLREELALNAQKLKSNSAATLLIQGHTDVIGDPDYNARLSVRRADSVARYFIDRGISRSRITFEGFGMNNPLMENVLPEGRMMNRRVEIYILY